MSSGLRRGRVTLSPYGPSWPEDFQQEKAVLDNIFKGEAAAIEHIGSTAVPGLSAKPIIDIEVGLRRFNRWHEFVAPLQAIGYTFMPERVGGDQVFLPKGSERRRTHYLHLTEYESAEWRKVLLFRDALRNHKHLRVAYERLKKQLANLYADDRKRYTDGKAAFIERLLEAGA